MLSQHCKPAFELQLSRPIHVNICTCLKKACVKLQMTSVCLFNMMGLQSLLFH